MEEKKINKKKLIIMLVIMVVSAVLAVVSYIFLPETIITQIGSNPTTMPKLLGIAIPFAISEIFAVIYYRDPDGLKKLIVSLVGVALYALLFIFNH